MDATELLKLKQAMKYELPEDGLVRLVEHIDQEKEKAYVKGCEMARRLLRLQLGLSVESDRC